MIASSKSRDPDLHEWIKRIIDGTVLSHEQESLMSLDEIQTNLDQIIAAIKSPDKKDIEIESEQ